ncbi:MAG: glycosyltransferase family 4 protein [Thermoplasmata archaeon]
MKHLPLIRKHIELDSVELLAIAGRTGYSDIERLLESVVVVPIRLKTYYGVGLLVGYFLYLTMGFLCLLAAVRKHRPHLLISLAGHPYTGLVTVVAGLTGRASVVRISEPTRCILQARYRRGKMLARLVERIEDYVFSVADVVVANKDMDWYCRGLSSRLTVISQGVDLDLFNPYATPLITEEGEPRIITVSRLHREKRIGELIEACLRLRKRHPEIRLHVVGHGPERRALETTAEKLGISEAIIFHGHQPPDRIPGLLTGCQVFVLPSVAEGGPIAALEAMACGVPVVVSRSLSLGGWFVDHENCLCAVGDPEGIARAVELVVSNADLERRIRSAALRYLRNRHDVEMTRSRFTKLLLNLASGKGRSNV